MSSADMSVGNVWVMSVTSDRVLIEEGASYEPGASPVKGINRLGAWGGPDGLNPGLRTSVGDV